MKHDFSNENLLQVESVFMQIVLTVVHNSMKTSSCMDFDHNLLRTTQSGFRIRILNYTGLIAEYEVILSALVVCVIRISRTAVN